MFMVFVCWQFIFFHCWVHCLIDLDEGYCLYGGNVWSATIYIQMMSNDFCPHTGDRFPLPSLENGLLEEILTRICKYFSKLLLFQVFPYSGIILDNFSEVISTISTCFCILMKDFSCEFCNTLITFFLYVCQGPRNISMLTIHVEHCIICVDFSVWGIDGFHFVWVGRALGGSFIC